MQMQTTAFKAKLRSHTLKRNVNEMYQMDPSQCIAKRCKEQTVMLCNLMQKADEMRCKMVQDGARWNPMELDGTGQVWNSRPLWAYPTADTAVQVKARENLGHESTTFEKKMGLGQVNGIEMAAGWVSMCFNVSRCCQNVSPFQCWPLQKIASLFLWFFWLQQLCCALKDSLRFQHWLLKARLAALMLGRTSTIIQFDDGIIELEPLKIFENCHLLLPWFPCLATRPCLVLHSLSIQDQIVGLSLHQFGSG